MLEGLLAILGRQPEISAAELCARAERDGAMVLPMSNAAALVQGVTDPAAWFASFGGLQKAGVHLGTFPSLRKLQPALFVQSLLECAPREGKVIFGISAYGNRTLKVHAEALAREVKRRLAEKGRSVRFVRGDQGRLSSVVVEKQGLLTRGAEFLLVAEGKNIHCARTFAVQAFEEFSERDYGRPSRDSRSGMLPPKLARIIVNLAGVEKDATLLDPFCGSGTILQEATLLGIRSLIGSDTAARAIRETKENLAWLSSRTQYPLRLAQLLQRDVRALTDALMPASIDAIVTEPYLGPPMHGNESSTQIRVIQRELSALYEDAFAVFTKLLKPGGQLVFLLPVFLQLRGAERFMGLDRFLMDYGFRLRQPLPPALVPWYTQDLTFRHTLLYHRPGQHVGREILLFHNRG